MSVSLVKGALVATIVALSSIVPASTALANEEEVTLGSCPEGYRGVVVGVTTSATGSREVRLCYKTPPPATQEQP